MSLLIVSGTGTSSMSSERVRNSKYWCSESKDRFAPYMTRVLGAGPFSRRVRMSALTSNLDLFRKVPLRPGMSQETSGAFAFPLMHP